MFYKLFAIEFSRADTLGGPIKGRIMPNQQLTKELYKPIIRKFEKRKVYSSFKDNIFGADFAHMQLISKYK